MPTNDEALYEEEIVCAESGIAYVHKAISSDGEKVIYTVTQGKDQTTRVIEASVAESNSHDWYYDYTLLVKGEEEVLQTLTGGTDNFVHSGYNVFIDFVDLNLDGYADMQLTVAEGTLNFVYEFYLWNPSSKTFEKVLCDEEILAIGYEICDGYLKLWGRNDASSGVMYILRWDGNRLILESQEKWEVFTKDNEELTWQVFDQIHHGGSIMSNLTASIYYDKCRTRALYLKSLYDYLVRLY